MFTRKQTQIRVEEGDNVAVSNDLIKVEYESGHCDIHLRHGAGGFFIMPNGKQVYFEMDEHGLHIERIGEDGSVKLEYTTMPLQIKGRRWTTCSCGHIAQDHREDLTCTICPCLQFNGEQLQSPADDDEYHIEPKVSRLTIN